MKLLALSAQICNLFSSATAGEMRTIQKVKEFQPRDVVTSLDQFLHQLVACFVDANMPGCKLMSEEGEATSTRSAELCEGEWLVVDPMDGSNNYALSLPGYGFMAAYLNEGFVKGTAIVMPEYDLYMVIEDDQMVISQPFDPAGLAKSSSIYYAYPPKLSSAAKSSRELLFELIDSKSSGFYRYGCSCIGLYNLVIGKHAGFIGHGIRLWDALAFFPILNRFGIHARYCITGSDLFLVASRDICFLDESCSIISSYESVEFTNLNPQSRLVITI